jgi:TonB-dependent receptor
MKNFSLLTIFIIINISGIFAQTGNLSGIVTDASDNSPLIGANVFVAGTSIGTATDRDGKYRLTKLKAGKNLVLFKYLGYGTDSVTIDIVAGKTLSYDVKLSPAAIEGKEVVVTSQLLGQAAAINQQLTSNTIVNVVSKDKIEELPDQNAAESVGRLPGISVERDAGEGTKVVVRGLSPRFNSITVNGEQIPSTDPEDRSVDLSMVSSDMLEGIEVFKALTPDKDADAVGGTVNFVIKKAPKGLKGDFRVQEGYNNHENDFSPYKSTLSLSNRFFDNKLGILATGNIQRANRGSDVLDASYLFSREKRGNEEFAKIDVDNLNLGDRKEIRKRYGASLEADYDLGYGSIMLSSFLSKIDRDETRRRKRYRVSDGYVEYWLRHRLINTTLFTNSLTGNFDLGLLNSHLDVQGAISSTKQDMPFSHDSQFRELGAFYGSTITDQGPQYIPQGAKNNLDQTTFYQDFLDAQNTNDRNITGQFDWKIPFIFSNAITGNLKFGSKIRDKYRKRNISENMTLAFAIDTVGRQNPNLFDITREGKIKIDNFYDNNYDPGTFLEGQYVFGPAKGLSIGALDNFMHTYWNKYVLNGAVSLEDYEAGETVYSGYIMSEFKIGSNLIFLPGFRIEQTRTDYKNIYGDVGTDAHGQTILLRAKDTVGVKTYSEFLPMIHLKYKISPFFDIRLAFTRTLARPDYFNLVPWQRISYLDQTVERGNPNLKHTRVWNYDAFLSLYNELGLFTLGGFYKILKDIDYIRSSRIQTPGPTLGYQLTEPENSTQDTKVYGFEIDVETNLKFLPDPFDGIVISANYSWIRSKTYYPFFEIGPRSPLPPYSPTIIDTVRDGRMPGQANEIANLSIGYEKGEFSGRVSMIYQGDALMTVGTRSELDGYTNATVRWDMTAQYQFIKNLSIYFDMNNFTNQPERAYLGLESFPTNEEYFGWTADLGFRFKL